MCSTYVPPRHSRKQNATSPRTDAHMRLLDPSLPHITKPPSLSASSAPRAPSGASPPPTACASAPPAPPRGALCSSSCRRRASPWRRLASLFASYRARFCKSSRLVSVPVASPVLDIRARPFSQPATVATSPSSQVTTPAEDRDCCGVRVTGTPKWETIFMAPVRFCCDQKFSVVNH